MAKANKAYYGSRISPNITLTPEGFIICHNVPIARVGWQDYLGHELGVDMKKVKVYRSEEEVFHPATIASFEGKAVTDEHPGNWIDTNNVAIYERGHAQNVRRGIGEESDFLLADLFVKNPVLINMIQNDVKREVSCGYDCMYVPIEGEEGKYEQKQIRGNHVAIVPDGRAGSRVAIKDNKPKEETGGTPKMSKKITKNLLAAIGFKHMMQDAEPEEIMAATKAMSEDAEETFPAAKKEAEDEGGDALSLILQKLTSVEERLAALEKTDQGVHEEMGEMDALEKELENEDATNEEAVTIPAEEMDSDVLEPGFMLEASEKPKNPITTGDRAKALDSLRTLRPIIASISDPKERKRASDALCASLKGSLGTSTKVPQGGGYGTIMNGISQNVNKQVQDAKEKAERDERQAGKDWAKRFNPHYKEKE